MKYFGIIILTIASLFISSCDKEKTEPIQYLGSIKGQVYLFEENGNLSELQQGVKVQIINKEHSAITNEDGNYQIKDLEAGTYDISFSKIGIGTFYIYNFQFDGNYENYIMDTVYMAKKIKHRYFRLINK